MKSPWLGQTLMLSHVINNSAWSCQGECESGPSQPRAERLETTTGGTKGGTTLSRGPV